MIRSIATKLWIAFVLFALVVLTIFGVLISQLIVLAPPAQSASTNLWDIRLLILGFALVAVLLATLLAWLTSKTVSRPLLQINEMATHMIHGDFSNKVEITAVDEVGRLGRTLNILSTELEDSLNELSREKDRLASIISSLSEGVVSFDLEGRITESNLPARELLDRQRDSLEGHNITECCPSPQMAELFRKVIGEKQRAKDIVVLEEKTLAVSMSPLRDAQGNMVGVVTVLRDISQEQKLENMRREFVANVSHELRTPLTLIQGYAEALEEGLAEDEEARNQMVDIIKEEITRLQRLVKDLLDLTGMEAGSLRLKVGPVDIRELLARAVQPFALAAAEKGVKLEIRVAEDLTKVQADGERLAQVLINLVDNALRYTPEGGRIVLAADRVGNQVGTQIGTRFGPEVEIRVRDTGAGIAAQDLDQVFDRFYKADKSRQRGGSGTGLGLAIARNIVLAHGGEIRVESEEGRGTEFVMSLPDSLSEHPLRTIRHGA